MERLNARILSKEGSRRAGATLGGAARMVPIFPSSFRISRLGRIRILTLTSISSASDEHPFGTQRTYATKNLTADRVFEKTNSLDRLTGSLAGMKSTPWSAQGVRVSGRSSPGRRTILQYACLREVQNRLEGEFHPY